MSSSSLTLIGVSPCRNAEGVLTIITLDWENGCPAIGISDGWSPHDAGTVANPQFWLNFRQSKWVLVGREYVEFTEPPGWFERKCAEANCEWFAPLVRRMAEGEPVSLRDVEDAYRNLHGKDEEMISGTWGTLCECSQNKPMPFLKSVINRFMDGGRKKLSMREIEPGIQGSLVLASQWLRKWEREGWIRIVVNPLHAQLDEVCIELCSHIDNDPPWSDRWNGRM